MKKKILIEGMSCDHCVKHVTEALRQIPGVNKVDVNLIEKTAIIESMEEIHNENIIIAIDDAGYEIKKIEKI